MSQIEYCMGPQGQVLQNYSDCRSQNSFICGPLGSGKTVQTILKLFDLMCEQAPVMAKGIRTMVSGYPGSLLLVIPILNCSLPQSKTGWRYMRT